MSTKYIGIYGMIRRVEGETDQKPHDLIMSNALLDLIEAQVPSGQWVDTSTRFEGDIVAKLYGMPVRIDPILPDGCVEFRNERGTVIASMRV